MSDCTFHLLDQWLLVIRVIFIWRVSRFFHCKGDRGDQGKLFFFHNTISYCSLKFKTNKQKTPKYFCFTLLFTLISIYYFIYSFLSCKLNFGKIENCKGLTLSLHPTLATPKAILLMYQFRIVIYLLKFHRIVLEKRSWGLVVLVLFCCCLLCFKGK